MDPKEHDSSTNPWGLDICNPSLEEPIQKLSLAEIIAQQEEEERCCIVPTEIYQEEEESRQLQLAMEASLQQQDSSKDERLKEEEDKQLRLAIEASLRDDSCHPGNNLSAAALLDTSTQLLTQTELEQIHNALREMEDFELAQEAASLDLARALQQQTQQPTWVPPNNNTVPHVGVRTLPSSDFFHLKYGSTTNSNDNSSLRLEQYSNYMQHEDEYYYDNHDEQSGYRINEPNSSSWTRSRCGGAIVSSNGEIRTKHDVELKNLSNAHRLGLVTPVNDAAYNALLHKMKKNTIIKGVASNAHGRAENMSLDRTRGGAMDGAARLLIQKAINNQWIHRVNGAVKEGKEAIVYHADPDVAVKVFKRIQEFRKRGDYVDGDPRYSRKRFHLYSKREQVELWAEKEFRNLTRAWLAGVPCPKPFVQKQNILFMKFYGEDGWPCPQIREVHIQRGSEKWTHLYCQTLLAIRKLYHCARLVHSDLSEYNLLLCPDETRPKEEKELQIILIDFGQAVHLNHPSAGEYLDRDLSRVSSFFAGRGANVLSAEDARTFTLSLCEALSLDDHTDLIEDDETLNQDAVDFSSHVKQEEKCRNEGDDAENIKKVSPLATLWDDEKEYEKLQSLMSS